MYSLAVDCAGCSSVQVVSSFGLNSTLVFIFYKRLLQGVQSRLTCLCLVAGRHVIGYFFFFLFSKLSTTY